VEEDASSVEEDEPLAPLFEKIEDSDMFKTTPELTDE